VVTRAEIEEVLGGLERTLENMGVEPARVPGWTEDQIRANAACKLPVVDESHVLALFTGMLIGNSYACLYGGIAASPTAGRYFVALTATIRALMPLMDALPGAWGDPGVTFASWDDMLKQALEWDRQQQPPEEG
jgi:hypothetical protein